MLLLSFLISPLSQPINSFLLILFLESRLVDLESSYEILQSSDLELDLLQPMEKLHQHASLHFKIGKLLIFKDYCHTWSVMERTIILFTWFLVEKTKALRGRTSQVAQCYHPKSSKNLKSRKRANALHSRR